MAARGSRSPRALAGALWNALQAAMYPPDARNAELRRAFQEESQQSNGRVVRWVMLIAAPLNRLAVVVLVRNPSADPAVAAWIFWLVGVNSILAVLGLVAVIVAWARLPSSARWNTSPWTTSSTTGRRSDLYRIAAGYGSHTCAVWSKTGCQASVLAGRGKNPMTGQ